MQNVDCKIKVIPDKLAGSVECIRRSFQSNTFLKRRSHSKLNRSSFPVDLHGLLHRQITYRVAMRFEIKQITWSCLWKLLLGNNRFCWTSSINNRKQNIFPFPSQVVVIFTIASSVLKNKQSVLLLVISSLLQIV